MTIGREANRLPYWSCYGSRLIVRVNRREVALRVHVLINWGDQWYVTHLDRVQHRTSTAAVTGAAAVGRAVVEGRAERGVVVCGSGVGAAIAANKLRGVRASMCHDSFSARQGVEDDDMNVLCLGARVIGEDLAVELLRDFLAARFSGAERHRRRLGKIEQLEGLSF